LGIVFCFVGDIRWSRCNIDAKTTRTRKEI